MSVESAPIRWDLHGAVVTLPDEMDSGDSGQARIALNEALADAPAVLVADMPGSCGGGASG